MEVEIRKATQEDLDGIIDQWKDFMDYHITFDRFWTRSKLGHEKVHHFIRSILKNPDCQVLVATKNKRIIGYQISQIQEHPPVLQRTRYCLVNDIAIDKKFRGKGIGSKMFEKVKKWAKSKGVDRMELQVAAGNLRAIRFYEKQGMKPYTIHMHLDF
jgi:ribosomal protein S18 acetylase RimI-like enzyme